MVLNHPPDVEILPHPGRERALRDRLHRMQHAGQCEEQAEEDRRAPGPGGAIW